MKRFLLLTLALTCLILTAFPAQGSGESSSGYRVILDDGADLLTPDEEQRVLEAMTHLSKYGDVIFWTTLARSSNTSMLRLQQYVDVNISPSVDHPSASFFIDMSSRTFCITSFILFSGMATHPPVQGFVGPKQCRKMADPRPGVPSSLKLKFRQYWYWKS